MPTIIAGMGPGNRTMEIFMLAGLASRKGKGAAIVGAGPDLAGAAVLA